MPDDRMAVNREDLDDESLRRRQEPVRRGGPGAHMIREKVKLKNAKGTLIRLGGYLEDKIWQLVLAMVCSLIATGVTIVGTRVIGIVVDEYIAKGDAQGLVRICLIMAGLFLFSALIQYGQASMMRWISQNATAHMRQDLFDKQAYLPVKYFDTHPSGDLMSRLTNDIEQISMTISQNLIQFVSGIVSLVGILVAMLFLSPLLTAISMAMIPVMFLITFILSRFTRKTYGRQQRQLGELNGYVEEIISGQKAVLLFNRQQDAKDKFSEINLRLKRSGILTFIGTGFLMPVMMFINSFTFVLVAAAGGYLIVQGDITSGIVFSFLIYMRNFSRPINELANMFTSIQGALAGAERVFEVLDEEVEQDRLGAEELRDVVGHVSMDHASFSYVQGKPVIIDNSLKAEPGKMTALVGPTGAGKTTLISLLARFYDLGGGEIAIDGKDLSSLTRDSVRKNMGIVLQDTFLFSETVRDNIRYGKPEASHEEVVEAAKIAGAHGFIERLPEGYDTVLTDNGDNFSQGQRQLLSIARVILTKPSILILDEATSSVDTGTEIKIQEALMKLMEGRTSFVIAHRLSTIKNAHQILVVNNGRIMERGTHQELLDLDGFYANLYNSQFRTGLVE
ncbi:MAG: ABC transporter ATP-binding protein/permease [Peptococcaceae bacterium]|jgi:ATP-binding cassette subfamily B protein|nr:ABC transporter ATP-binding protein/permease [Peptococcaceae bacterium]